EMEARTFKGDSKAFFAYAQDRVDVARRELADRASFTASMLKSIDKCDMQRILGTVRAGLGPVVANVQRKLLRPPRRGEPSVPRWVVDREARNHVGALNVLAEAVKAQTEYSSIDTDVAIAVATSATLFVGGAATLGGKLAADAG